ncbi:hypothetical protein HELRODRAFT_168985 [Helobdella robusta]|uniref:Uncharacterized protein n=1 Tax=Helobdella robusta TaxID=6412 RepID=T1F181_HELRO|nr:hypothetical protein HELRODRAFT_168985 [Helobdella robusta]ESO09051.1 hypothetical protein HELRODRAFT_168985 [Helobdella robusta]
MDTTEDRKLNLKNLLNMSATFNSVDIVRLAVRHMFMGHIKSQPSVRNTFFKKHILPGATDRCRCVNYSNIILTREVEGFREFDFDKFAVLYVCQVICHLKKYFNFHEMIDEYLVEEELSCIYSSPIWLKLGLGFYSFLYKELVRDHTTGEYFKSYCSHGKLWAKKIAEKYQSELTVLRNFSFADTCPDVIQKNVNELLIKVHILDPTMVNTVYNLLHKVIPNITTEIYKTRYLGDVMDWSMIRQEVESAILKSSLPSNVSRLSLDKLEHFHGIQVCEFITNEAKEYGLWTGRHPKNLTTSELKDRCSIS